VFTAFWKLPPPGLEPGSLGLGVGAWEITALLGEHVATQHVVVVVIVVAVVVDVVGLATVLVMTLVHEHASEFLLS